MLPKQTTEQTAELTARYQRQEAARQAMGELQVWIAAERPELRLPVGNLPSLWYALAGANRLDAHLSERRVDAATPVPSADPVYRRDRQLRLEALERFHGRYTRHLNAV